MAYTHTLSIKTISYIILQMKLSSCLLVWPSKVDNIEKDTFSIKETAHKVDYIEIWHTK